MPSLPVVEDLNIFEYLLLGFLPGTVPPVMRQFHFQGMKSGQDNCHLTDGALSIPAIATPTHAADKLVTLDGFLIQLGGILATSVTVYHQAS